jgi:hypothetical protein
MGTIGSFFYCGKNRTGAMAAKQLHFLALAFVKSGKT